MLKAPSSTVNCSTRAGWRCSPITRAPTSAVSSPVTRLAGLSQGRSRITERSPVRDSPRPRRLLWVCDPARRSGRGATFAPKSRIGDVWSATLPQSDKGRVARYTSKIGLVSTYERNRLFSTVDTPVRYVRDMYVHSEDLPLHRSRISAAAGDWLSVVQNTANRDTSFSDLMLEKVAFIRGYIAYDRLVRTPSPTRDGC